MRSIKDIIEGIISQGKFVGSRGLAFRASSSSDASRTDTPGAHSHGLDIGARRNYAHQRATKQKTDQSAKQREQEVARRNKEAEQRRKETAKMASEETFQEETHVFHVHMKSMDTRLHKMVGDNASEPIGQKPKGDKLVLKVKAANKREATNKVAKHVARNFGVGNVSSIVHKGIQEETIEEGAFAKHETDHLKQMHARDVGTISRYKGKMGSGIDDVIDREHAIRKELTKRGHSVEKPKHKLVIEDKMSSGTEARTKIKNVARMDDADPKSEKSILGKQGQIKTKIIDEEKPLMSDKNFGLPASLIAAARQIIEKKQDDDVDPKKMTGGKTQVELNPETDDKVDESDAKKKHTIPKTEKEKKLAALASPKDKITHKDVLVGRGVVKEEEVEENEEVEQVDEGKWNYPKSMTKPIIDTYLGRTGREERKARKEWRKKIKAKTHNLLKTGKLNQEEVEQIDEMYTLKHTKTTDLDQPVKATEKHYDIHQKGKKVGEVVHHHNENGEHFYDAHLHGKSVPFDRKNGGRETARAFIQGVAKTKWHSKYVMKEEVEELDEVSKATLGSYVKKVAALPPEKVKPSREKGIEMASKKLHKEDVEEIDEKITRHDYEQAHLKRVDTPATGVRGEKTKKLAATRKLRNRDYAGYTIGAGPKGKLPEEVEFSEKEVARIEEIAKSFPAEIDEAVKKSKNVPSATTPTSSPIRGANQDQSGYGTKSSTADYTISDDISHKSAAMSHKTTSAKVSNRFGKLTTRKVKPKLDLDEGRGRPRKNPLPPGQETEGDDTHKHPMQQLEKISHAIEGNEPHFEHKDGSKTKISRHLARHIVAVHNSMRTSQEKDNFAQKVHANRDSLKAEMGKHL